MKNIIYILLLFLLASCAYRQDSIPDFVFSYPKDTSDIRLKHSFYGRGTFLLIDRSKVFFHKKKKDIMCATFLDISKPPKIDLMPNNFTEIQIIKLKDFLKSFKDSINEDDRLLATIVSPKDTVKHPAFKILTDYFEQNGFSKQYGLRKWTEEEQYALTAKIEKQNYNPKTIKWKTGFDTDYMDSLSTKK